MTKSLFAIFLFLFCASSFAQTPFLGKTADVWQLRLAIGDDQDRQLAAWALAQFGDYALADSVLEGARDPIVIYWGIHGLGKAAAGKLTEQQRRNLFSRLFSLTQRKEATTRIAAAEQLARASLHPDVSPAVSKECLDTALPVLIAALDDPQESAGVQAAAALVALGKQAAPARAKLQTASQSGGEYVKRLANRALQNLQE